MATVEALNEEIELNLSALKTAREKIPEHDCRDHVSVNRTCMQCGKSAEPRERAVVSVKLEAYVEDKPVILISEATLLGKPSRVKGEVYAAEVVTASGRHTLVPIADVEPANDEAEDLLTAPGPKARVVAA